MYRNYIQLHKTKKVARLPDAAAHFLQSAPRPAMRLSLHFGDPGHGREGEDARAGPERGVADISSCYIYFCLHKNSA